MGEAPTVDPMDTREQDTRAWVLHPDIRNADRDRDPARALDEAVALAEALPGL